MPTVSVPPLIQMHVLGLVPCVGICFLEPEQEMDGWLERTTPQAEACRAISVEIATEAEGREEGNCWKEG